MTSGPLLGRDERVHLEVAERRQTSTCWAELMSWSR